MPTINVTLVAQANIVSKWSASELPSTAGEQSVVHTAFAKSIPLRADSTPPASKKMADEFTGDQNLDLTALSDPEVGAVDATGLKVQVLLVNNLSTSATLTLSDGVANPYQLNGGDTIVIPPGGTDLKFFNDKLADVAAGAKCFDAAITAGQKFQLLLVMG